MRSVRPLDVLVQSEDFHRLVVENAPDLISVHATDGACLYVSPSAETMLGFTSAQLTGADAFAHVHPDDLERLRETLRPDVPAGAVPPTAFTTEIRCRHRKGHYIWLEIHGRRIAPEAPPDEQVTIFISRHIASERLLYADQHEREIRRRYTPPFTDWYWETDERGRFTFFPEYEERAFGTPLLRVIGRTRQEIAEDPLSPGMLEYSDKLARRESFKNIQYSYVSDENGSVAHAIISGEPFFLDGVFSGFRGVGRNITRGHQLKEQLAKLSSENQSLLDNSLDVIATADESGRIIRVNAAAQRILGYTPRALIGQQYIDFFVPEDREKTLAIVTQLYREGGEVFHFENRWQKPDGGVVYLAWSAHWSPDNRALHATGRDITQYHHARTQAQAFNERFTSMLESMGDSFFSLNRDWVITYTNRKTSEFVGRPGHELMGRAIGEAVPEVLTSSVFPYYQRAMETGEQLAFEAFYEPRQAWVDVRVYPHDDGISVFFNDVTERKQADAKLEHLATHDYLTGLPNRVRLDMRLQDMLAEGDQSRGVFFIDLDRFKDVNDSLGHAAGDIVLCEVASRLTASIRPTDVIARLSGDEFVIVADCRNGADTARKLATKLLGLLSTPMMVRDKELYIGASIGISMFPEDGTTREILFQKADTAMYRAKLDGRDCFRFFTDSMREEVDARIAIESELRRALERKQFEIHYQPRIDAKTLRTTAVEALIRWNHPTLGRVSPSQFIPIAEEIGIIQPIGAWVLENACRDILALSARRDYPLHLSVNLSARQLQPVTLCDHVRSILRSTGFPARLLELELTETALVEDIDRSADVLLELKDLGVHLSLDDFGTGYSSLTYLRRFPISLLKLDQSFMNDNKGALDTIRFLTAIIVFAHSLNLKVVAEGVEKRETLESLQWAGCDEVQGYLFAKPMPLPDLERYIISGQDEITTGRWRAL